MTNPTEEDKREETGEGARRSSGGASDNTYFEAKNEQPPAISSPSDTIPSSPVKERTSSSPVPDLSIESSEANETYNVPVAQELETLSPTVSYPTCTSKTNSTDITEESRVNEGEEVPQVVKVLTKENEHLESVPSDESVTENNKNDIDDNDKLNTNLSTLENGVDNKMPESERENITAITASDVPTKATDSPAVTTECSSAEDSDKDDTSKNGSKYPWNEIRDTVSNLRSTSKAVHDTPKRIFQQPPEEYLPIVQEDAEEVEPTVYKMPSPPDGGWGWIVVFGSFMIHVFGEYNKHLYVK